MVANTQVLPSHGCQGSYRNAVLRLMASKQVLFIESLLRVLPWIRWGELFSIVGMCMDERILVLEKRGFLFDVRMKGARYLHESRSGKPAVGLKEQH